MSAPCSHCERPLVRVAVPSEIREFAPESAAVAGYCPRCLRTYPLEDDDESETEATLDAKSAEVPSAIPTGEGGVALVLAVGLLDSLATNRPAIQSLVEYAERAGADVFLTFDRLAADETIDPHVDLARRRRQLESILE
ncbi:hypothetical protein D3D02_02870 [Halobellus sp. Atlit-38R]|uniref:DUF6276 family protein n=1 Tax=Halobellus sp. Atlit-38R TaxID=2282131 RepID=UPI000EF17E89|nr:DUF6276 family protein [Halobellus sp. Atlit-38R]RLM90728.1 hypothetical protein D3D02_02870 [Halobellus sp. Atlit-38R]